MLTNRPQTIKKGQVSEIILVFWERGRPAFITGLKTIDDDIDDVDNIDDNDDDMHKEQLYTQFWTVVSGRVLPVGRLF